MKTKNFRILVAVFSIAFLALAGVYALNDANSKIFTNVESSQFIELEGQIESSANDVLKCGEGKCGEGKEAKKEKKKEKKSAEAGADEETSTEKEEEAKCGEGKCGK